MSYRIKITPEMVRDIANDMQDDCARMSDIIIVSSKAAELIRDGARNSVFGNVDGKTRALISRMKEFNYNIDGTVDLLRYSADSFEDVDRCILAGSIERAMKLQESVNRKTTDLGEWNSHATDSEYAVLSSIVSDITAGDKPREGAKERFLEEIAKRTPENDPIRFVDPDHVAVVQSDDGFGAVVIVDDNGNATVIYAGTNDDVDWQTDAAIAAGWGNSQLDKAKKLMDIISERYSNITVNSLGGYLATESAIYNSNVKKCINFDSPGRDGVIFGNFQELTGHKDLPNEDVITSYVTQGVINKGGLNVGEVHHVDVPWEGWRIFGLDFGAKTFGHDINDMYDRIGGYDSLKNNWDNYDYPIPSAIEKETGIVSHTDVIDKHVVGEIVMDVFKE